MMDLVFSLVFSRSQAQNLATCVEKVKGIQLDKLISKSHFELFALTLRIHFLLVCLECLDLILLFT